MQDLSLEEIRQALGLLPRSEIVKRSKVARLFPRRSGRTTDLLLESVFLSQTKMVYIVGLNFRYSVELADTACLMCRQIGLNPRVKPGYHMIAERFQGVANVLFDHSYLEAKGRKTQPRSASSWQNY